MRFAPYLFAALLFAGCGGHATVTPTTGDQSTEQTAVTPMDQQVGGAAFTNVNIGPPTLTPGISGLMQVPGDFRVTTALPQDRVFFTYNYFNNSQTSSSTGTLMPSQFIVDSNKTAVFTVTPSQSKIFRVPLSSITPSVTSCPLLQAANNGLAQLPNGTFAVGDAGNHINILRWPLGGSCTMLSRRMNPDLGAVIGSITSDPSNNIFFSDSRKIQRLTPSGTFQNAITAPAGFSPLEVRFKFNRLFFTFRAKTGTAGIVGNIDGSMIHRFNVPRLSRSPFAADMDSRLDTWFVQDNAIVSAMNPSGTVDTVVDPGISSTYQADSIAVGADGQVYFAAPNSWTMGIFNRARMTLNPTSVTVSPGAHKTFTVFEISQPFLGTIPATFSAQSSNNAVAKLSSFTNSGGQGTGTILGVKPGTVKFTVIDGTGNSAPLKVTVP